MRSLTNLGWPDTPYGSDKRPFPGNVRLLTALNIRWADDGSDAVPVGAAAVFVPVHRTKVTTITAGTLHFGYRSVVTEDVNDQAELLRVVDRILVQGRRHAAALAWHSYPDDLHAICALAKERLPGVSSVGDAWHDRATHARGVAPVVDTAADLGRIASIADLAEHHGIDIGLLLNALGPCGSAQPLHDLLSDTDKGTDRALLTDQVAVHALGHALAVALLAGEHLELLTWNVPFAVQDTLANVAWSDLPSLFSPNGPTPAQ
jgi:hypothetical protein